MQPRLQGNTRVITLHLSQHARTVHDDKASSTCNNKITFNKQPSGVQALMQRVAARTCGQRQAGGGVQSTRHCNVNEELAT